MDGPMPELAGADVGTASLIRVLHITDFHISTPRIPAQMQAIGKIMDAVRKEAPIDVVVITGDISTSGKKDGYQEFQANVLSRLSDLRNGGAPDIFIVPGNHDLDIPSCNLDTGAIRTDFIQSIDVTGENPFRTYVCARLSSFRDLMPEPGGHAPGGPPTASADWLRTQGGFARIAGASGPYAIGIVGINTTWLIDRKDSEDLKGKLDPGTSLLVSHLDSLRGRCQQILVIGHHPLDWLDPVAKQRVVNALRQYHAIYLHGHWHSGDGEILAGRRGVCIALQARAADVTGRRQQNQQNGGYSILEFRPGAKTFHIRPMIVVNTDGRPDHDAFPDFDFDKAANAFELPLPNAADFLGWMDDSRNVWTSEAGMAPLGTPDANRWRCYLMGGAPDRSIVSRLGDSPQAQAALDVLEGRKGCGAYPFPVAWIETPAGEGRTTAIYRAVNAFLSNGANRTVHWRKVGAQQSRLPPDRVLGDDDNRLHLFVIEDATACPNDVRALIESAGSHPYAARFAFLLGGDLLARARIHQPPHGSCHLFDRPVEWNHESPPEFSSWQRHAADAGLVGASIATAAKDDILPEKPGWSWLGGLLVLDANSPEAWQADPKRCDALFARLREGIDDVTRRAYHLVAAAHSAGYPCLTPEVLAQALFGDADTNEVERQVLPRLGPEIRKVRLDGATILLTRHRAIATAYIDKFQSELPDPLKVLATSAADLFKGGGQAPSTCWLDLATAAGALDVLAASVAWGRHPLSAAIELGIRYRETGGYPRAIEILESALAGDVNAEGHRKAFALLADLYWRARGHSHEELAVFAALASLRDIGRDERVSPDIVAASVKLLFEFMKIRDGAVPPEIQAEFTRAPTSVRSSAKGRSLHSGSFQDGLEERKITPRIALQRIACYISRPQGPRWTTCLAHPSRLRFVDVDYFQLFEVLNAR